MTAAELEHSFATWDLEYAVFQEELGTGGTRHFQGYLEFKNRIRLTQLVRKRHAARMHLEKRRGTRTQARDYSMKADSRVAGPYEFGDWQEAAQGRRSDLATVCALLAEGGTLVDVAESNPVTYVRYHRGLQSLINVQPRTRPDAPEVTLLLGPPGCGKTRSVRDAEPFDELWVSPPSSGMKWFDDYQGQSAALFDDFDGKASQVPLMTTLSILDRYAIRVPVKGSHTWWLPKRVYITSNVHPRNWYDWHSREHQYPALIRRFTHVVTWPFEEPLAAPFMLTPDSEQWQSFWDNHL